MNDRSESIAAIILAAGAGTRMKSSRPKQLMPLGGLPVFLYSLLAFDRFADRLIVVTGEEQEEQIEERLRGVAFAHTPEVVRGGAERWQSSLCGIRAAAGADLVCIHDAARPCVSGRVIAASLAAAREKGSGIAAVPCKDTIKEADAAGLVLSTPDRAKLRIVQTPQTFRYALIRQAYDELERRLRKEPSGLPAITDDACVVEAMLGQPVYLSAGDYRNIKLTTPEDFPVAEAFLGSLSGEESLHQ